jgi:hypothetical protein
MIILSSVVFMAVLVWFLFAYVFVSENQRILKSLEKGRLAVQNGSILSLGGLLAPDYVDSSGMDKAMALRALADFFQSTTDRQIVFTDVSIEVNEDRAQALVAFVFKAKGNTNDRWLNSMYSSSEANPIKIEVTLIQEGRRWFILRTAHS